MPSSLINPRCRSRLCNGCASSLENTSKTNRSSILSIVVVGSVAFDGLKTPYGVREKVLGGAATYFSLSASYFTDVRVVGVVGDDFTPEHEAVMNKRGVDTRGLQHADGK